MLESDPQAPPSQLPPLPLEKTSKLGAAGDSGGFTLNSGVFIPSGINTLVVTLTVGGVKLGKVNPVGPATFIFPMFIATLGSFTVTLASVGAVIVDGTVTVGAVTVGAVTDIVPI